jgi:hypothetical protein
MLGEIGEPGTGNHDASRCDPTLMKRGQGGIIDRLSQAYVVSMDNQQFGVGWIAQFFGHGLLALQKDGHRHENHDEYNRERETLFHINGF